MAYHQNHHRRSWSAALLVVVFLLQQQAPVASGRLLSSIVVEGQTRQALSTAGLDLACGFLHADRRGRDALVYNLMELARPAVDERVLTFLESATFHAGDFTRVSDGSCRLHPQLARAVVATCGVPQSHIAEHVAWLARFLVPS
jgi:CRISPR-associated protein Cas1